MSTPIPYFQRMYAADPDPWDYENRWYDQRKHRLTAGILPKRRYRSAFEPGCSTGRLTELLAPSCDRLLAVDAVPSAVASATRRLAGTPGVTIGQALMPQDWPDRTFDLVVMSELAYYFDDAELDELITRAVGSLEPDGDLVAVHWRWPVTEHYRDGDEVHAALAERPELTRTAEHVEADFRLEVYTRVPPEARSVAQREGLA
jgi:SAM-dependent methyltransferase